MCIVFGKWGKSEQDTQLEEEFVHCVGGIRSRNIIYVEYYNLLMGRLW